MAYKQNFVKRKFPWIDIFDHEVPAVINTMGDLTVGLFGHLDISSRLDLGLKIKDTVQILRGPALKTF